MLNIIELDRNAKYCKISNCDTHQTWLSLFKEKNNINLKFGIKLMAP